MLLSEAKKLQIITDGVWNRVDINPDLTPMKSEVRKELVKTMKENEGIEKKGKDEPSYCQRQIKLWNERSW